MPVNSSEQQFINLALTTTVTHTDHRIIAKTSLFHRKRIGYPAVLAALLFFLLSCKDHQSPSPDAPRFRLNKVAVTGNEEQSTTTYIYDGSGRLSSISKAYIRRARGGNVDTYYTSTLQYDSQGRVISFNNQPDNSAPGTITSSYTYNYDKKGNITRIDYIPNPQSPTIRTTFYVDYSAGSRFPNRIKTVDEQFQTEVIYDYTYAGNNVVSIKKSSSSTSLPDFNYTRTYQFDDKPNPFYGLYPGVPEPDLFNSAKQNTFYENNTFNQNNMLLPGYTYEYDSYGNLTKSTGTFTATYEYERY